MQIRVFVPTYEHDTIARRVPDHAQRRAFRPTIRNGSNNQNGADAQPHQCRQAEQQKVRSDSAWQSNLQVPDEHTESIPNRKSVEHGTRSKGRVTSRSVLHAPRFYAWQ